MMLECPSCDARFLVPDAAVGVGGRRVRCGRCQYVWNAKLPDPAAVAAKEAEAKKKALPDIGALLKDSPVSAQFPPANPKGSRPSYLPAAKKRFQPLAAANILLLCAIIIAAMLRYMPSTLGFGLSDGLAFSEIALAPMPPIQGERFTSDVPLYMLKGKIKNNGEKAIDLARIRVTLKDEKGAHRMPDYEPDEKLLAPGQSIGFLIERLPVADPTNAQFQVELGNWLELILRRYE